MAEKLLVFDVGTTGARSVIYDINGRELVKFYEEYPVERQPPGISEHNPIIWWNAIKNTCNQLVKKVNLDDIIGICAAFHRATTTIIDKGGNILHPALTWMDERSEMDPKYGRKEDVLRRTSPKLLWFQKNKPDLFLS